MYSIDAKSYVDQLGNLFFDVSYTEGDVLIQKRLPVEEYLSLFRTNCKNEETFVSIGKVPESVIHSEISTVRNDTFHAVVFLKAHKRAFSYYGKHFYIPFPAMIAVISVRGGVRQHTYLYALGTDEPTPDTPLMHYPFANVGSGGHCCYGNIVRNNVKDVTDAPAILEDFLCGDTNDDYYSSSERNSENLTQIQVIEAIQNMDSFPVSYLVSHSNGTVNDLLSGKFNHF